MTTLFNNHTPPQDRAELYALTDEQVLEIEPREEVASDEWRADGASPAPTDKPPTAESQTAEYPARAAVAEHDTELEPAPRSRPIGSQMDAALCGEPPKWLAERMADPQAGGEARELWNGMQQARSEAAAYREVFAKPEEARAAADRARLLEQIDQAYFGAQGANADALQASRAHLAAQLMREDPAAFREMVAAGLQALQASGQGIGGAGAAGESRFSRVVALEGQIPAPPPSPTGAAGDTNAAADGAQNAARQEFVAQYAAFEKAANEDLERAVGGAIQRSLEQALPGMSKTENAGLRGRLSAAIRGEVEAALQGDRQLAEQVGQVLAARTLDDRARTQVVRLIDGRAQQLLPGAAKRVLGEWTQTTLAAHQARTTRSNAANARADVRPAHSAATANAGNTRAPRNQGAAASNGKRAVDYRKLSDEQILDL